MIDSSQTNTTTKCTLNALKPPYLTQIVSDKRPKAIELQSNISNSDIFECILSSNDATPFNQNPLLVVFGTNEIVMRIFHESSIILLTWHFYSISNVEHTARQRCQTYSS